MSEPGKALSKKVRDKAFAVNHEHPALMKTLAGLSAKALAPGAMSEGAAMRLPAQIVAGIGVGLLFLAGFYRGATTAGLVAAGFFILLPRVWFNAGLHAFDVPVAVAMLAVVLAYRRAQHSTAWAIVAGLLLGLAIAVKHNALFLGVLLAAHYYGTALLERRKMTRREWIPLPLVSMAILGPLVAFALWPWLWSAPIDRFTEYLTFHREHSWYNMEFLGVNYNQPPMPMSYAAVMTWATVPTALLLLAGLGLALGIRDRDYRSEALLWGLLGLFPIVLISLPSTPIFGGTKHWITAYPFLGLAAAEAWTRLWRRADFGKRTKHLRPIGLAVLLGPAALATIDGHPWNLSQYAPLAGGPRGAADLGLNRGFWGHAVLPLVPELNSPRTYIHDISGHAHHQYVRENRWPEGVQPTPAHRAKQGLIFHERHMCSDELQLWRTMGTTAPTSVLSLDDVPLTSLYSAP